MLLLMTNTDAFGHAVTLNFDFLTQNVIRSSVSQDAPVTKVWRKSINRCWRYSGNMKIWDVFGHAVTLTFDLLTPKSNQITSVSRCTSDKSLAKIRQQILEISRKHENLGCIRSCRDLEL